MLIRRILYCPSDFICVGIWKWKLGILCKCVNQKSWISAKRSEKTALWSCEWKKDVSKNLRYKTKGSSEAAVWMINEPSSRKAEQCERTILSLAADLRVSVTHHRHGLHSDSARLCMQTLRPLINGPRFVQCDAVRWKQLTSLLSDVAEEINQTLAQGWRVLTGRN